MLGQNGGSRTDTLIKLVLIFFISLLSFSVGTFVGKQFSDSQHKMASLESEYDGGNRETASVPSDALEVKPDEALTDQDIQKIADEFTKPDDKHEGLPEATTDHETPHAQAKAEHGAVHAAVEDTRHVANVESKPAHGTETAHAPNEAAHHTAAPSSAAERIAEGKAPSENKQAPVAATHMPANLPTTIAASSIGKYTIQISAHQTKEQAETKAAELKTKGFSAFVVPALVKGTKWYRVSIGLFDKMPEAKLYREKLMKEAGIASAFVQQIVQ